jgi:hypothetical protein
VTPNDLFRGLIEQLEEVVASPTELALVTCTPHLRTLIMDSNPLYNQVRRQRRAAGLPNPPPHFVVGAVPAIVPTWLATKPVFLSLMDGISPRMTPEKGTETLNTGQFLGRTAVYVQGKQVTVKEVIHHVGYVGGLLHAGEPKTDVQGVLADMDARFKVWDTGSVARGLRGIADVVATGLRSLIIET